MSSDLPGSDSSDDPNNDPDNDPNLGPLDPFADSDIEADLVAEFEAAEREKAEADEQASKAGGAGAGPGGFGMFGDLSKLLGGQKSPDWGAARQMAVAVASGGESEPNVDPAERMRWEQLARVAELQVESVTPLSTSGSGLGITITPVTRTQWVQQSLDAYEPRFKALGEALEQNRDDDQLPDSEDPAAAMLAPLMAALTPMMLSMTAGSMIGHLGATSFGQYDLPVPRTPSDELLVVPANVEAFGQEWSLPGDDLRMWICIHEVAWHAVLGVPSVRSRMEQLLDAYTAGFVPDPNALTNAMEGLDFSAMMEGGDPMAGVQDLFSDPEVLLGAGRNPAQVDIEAQLRALLSVLVGYVDHVVDLVSTKLLSSQEMITEALERRRVTASASDTYVERLLGIELDQDCYDAGEEFIAGVLARADEAGLDRLWDNEANLPTPAEVAAPGLWLARINLNPPEKP